ncbi:MAG: hypothetical protein OHK93_002079 [Ramalina farinacea]|uniref:Rrn9 domain-containing protein n=1 Tax=Ramalina farinacea TaxID=258253 RepID=A0AA43TWV5_9LECA|nr:hypothetical protein [Ramalina farinacea]
MSNASETELLHSESEPFQSGQRQPPGDSLTESDGSSVTSSFRTHQPPDTQQLRSNGQPVKAISSRPNKFHGPSSTWRNRNASECNLAASLDNLTAQDLSIHLFNAHKLKQSGLQQRVNGVDPEDHFGFTWTPPKKWTAWPMPPDIVPREGGEAYGRKLVRMPHPYLPKPVKRAGLLQELLLAQVLREAKVRLGQREWEPIQEPKTLKPLEQSKQRTSDKGGQTSTEWENPDSETATAGGRRGKRPKLAKTAAQVAKSGNKQLIPVMLVDDPKAMGIAQPLIRSVGNQLDTLLGSLHRARQSYHAMETDDRSASISRSTKRHRGRSATPAPKHSIMRDSLSSSGDEDNDPNVVPTGAQGRRQSSQSQRFRMRKKKLNLRDWNDVIGLASASGTSQEVIETSRQRCEALLGMHDTKSMGTKSTKSGEPTSGDGESTSNSSDSTTSEVGSDFEPITKHSQTASSVSSDNLFQPIKAKRSWRRQSRKR